MTNIIIKNQDTNSCILSTGEIVDFSMRNYNQLLKEIKEWRLEKSRLIQLPAYCIFPDKTIHSIISVLPTTTEKLWLVSGFNEIIIDNYGKELIELISSFLLDNDIVDVIYGTSAFDLHNHKVKGILGYLGLLNHFNNTQTHHIDPIPTVTEKSIKTSKYINPSIISDYFDEEEYLKKHIPANKPVQLNDIVKIKFDNDELDIFECQIVQPIEEIKPVYTGVRVGDNRLSTRKVRVANDENCFSSDTPFAKAILGKYINESFTYSVNDVVVSGRIIDIIPANNNK